MTKKYTVTWKRVYSILDITSSNINRFSKFLHFHNFLKIGNKAIIKYPITRKTRHYTTTLWKYWCQKTSMSCALWQSSARQLHYVRSLRFVV